MNVFDSGGIKELVLGGIVAIGCFSAPTLMEFIFPEQTVIHGVVKELPYLGSLVIALTIVRLLHRKKAQEKDVESQ